MKIAGLTIDPPLILAPMAGLTHLAFRQLVASFGGCGLYFSEMLSARMLRNNVIARSNILCRLSNETPFFYQLMGNIPKDFEIAVKHIERLTNEKGEGPDGIDINMGCSAPEIRKRGAGSALMGDIENAKRIIAACRTQTILPITVKIRLGHEENPDELISFAQSLHAEGIDAITLHPRLIKEKFKRSARWKYVKELKDKLSIPVIGNGDIQEVHEIDERMKQTGCDGIMIGRLAVIKPWIFRSYVDGVEPDVDMKIVYFEFVELLKKYFEPVNSLQLLKNFTRYYSKNFAFGHHLDMKIKNAPDFFVAISKAEVFFQ